MRVICEESSNLRDKHGINGTYQEENQPLIGRFFLLTSWDIRVFSEPPPEGGLDTVTYRQGAI